MLECCIIYWWNAVLYTVIYTIHTNTALYAKHQWMYRHLARMEPIQMLYICVHTVCTYTHIQVLRSTYNRFRVFSPNCTMHTAITHVISVLEPWSLHAWLCNQNSHETLPFQYVITWVITVCNVQSGLKTLKRLYQLWRLHPTKHLVYWYTTQHATFFPEQHSLELA